MKTLRVLAASAVVTIGAVALPAVASAHHPLLTGSTQCATGETWSVTWTARADADRPLTWRITAPTGYTPAGSQPDELPFTRTASYPTSQASASETVNAAWSNQATGTDTETVQQPDPCPDDDEETTTTTTAPATTTTTEPPATTIPPTDDTTPPPGTEPTTTTTEPPPAATTTPTTSPPPTAPTPPPDVPELPATGPVEIAPQVAAVMFLIAVGSIVLVATRRPVR